MWSRKSLKADAKTVFKENFSKFIAAGLIFTIISSLLYYNVSSTVDNENFDNYGILESMEPSRSISERGLFNVDYDNDNKNFDVNFFGNFFIASMSIMAFIFITILLLALRILIYNPLRVGLKSFYMKSYEEESKISYLFDYFKNNNWLQISGKMFMKDVYIFLWTLLFIIPGIIKSYEYYFVDYILAENPDMSLDEAIDISGEMTKGDKFNIFILDLSFIGWIFLSEITFKIGYIFLAPYMNATSARLYLFKTSANSEDNLKDDNYFDEVKK